MTCRLQLIKLMFWLLPAPNVIHTPWENKFVGGSDNNSITVYCIINLQCVDGPYATPMITTCVLVSAQKCLIIRPCASMYCTSLQQEAPLNRAATHCDAVAASDKGPISASRLKNQLMGPLSDVATASQCVAGSVEWGLCACKRVQYIIAQGLSMRHTCGHKHTVVIIGVA